jgi:hypothetical protein
MKAQLILLFLLASLISTNGLANNKEPKPEEKKTTKTKYEFNLFKFSSLDTEKEKSDSLKTNPTTLHLKRKEE